MMETKVRIFVELMYRCTFELGKNRFESEKTRIAMQANLLVNFTKQIGKMCGVKDLREFGLAIGREEQSSYFDFEDKVLETHKLEENLKIEVDRVTAVFMKNLNFE